MSVAERELEGAAALTALREELGGRALRTADVERIWRRVAGCAHLADLKVAWLGNHTLDPLLRQATALAFTHGVTLSNHAGGFDQHFQAILDPDAELHRFAPDVILLSLSLRGLAPRLVRGGAALPHGVRRDEARKALEHVQSWVEVAREHSAATLMICNFPRAHRAGLGLADAGSPAGDAALVNWLNGELAAAWRDDPQVHVLDLDAAIAGAGRLASWNPAMYYLAKIEWSGPGLEAAGELVARALRALVQPAKKCLLLDLDNTLWGGIVGEDGVEGLKVQPGDPIGEAFLEFQRAVLDIKARGVVLGLVSKNNREDVVEAFEHLEMPLELDDFATTRIDWEHKHVNIQAIANELNIGLNSVVFADDNPIECELIRQMLPEVEVMALPSDPAAYVETLLGCWHFDKLALTEEDARKTEQYRDNAARDERRRSAADIGSYLESLGTCLEIGRATAAELPRLHQLFGKTNQFNLTTRRYTPAELKQFADSDEWLFEWVRVRDNFGDLGLVGAWLVRLDPRDPEIDSFILSCRALGREVETAACNHIKQQVFAGGAEVLTARFLPTPKNRPAASFYEAQGFEVVDEGADGAKTYRIAAADGQARSCRVREITIKEDA
ncbi:MAG TPA: HAD-IIIC family phosphatase [Woeseiaceae bacterium]|nr:HAD-IIIC family phosphatase [Woeseiaceae bacterium]